MSCHVGRQAGIYVSTYIPMYIGMYVKYILTKTSTSQRPGNPM